MKQYDVLIIGAGPAGLTAALYAARSGLKTGIITKEVGGSLNLILRIENWPGFLGSGKELVDKIYKHVKKYDVSFVMDEVKEISKKQADFVVKTKKEELIAKALIITTGTDRKKLNIKGEKELLGKGISYCATCDGFFFKNKTVAVIGGSDCAAGSALALSDIAKKVYVLYRGEKLRCEKINSDRLESKKNVEIVYSAVPIEIKGKNKVESIVIEQKEKNREIKLDGVFVEIGAVALSELVKKFGLKVDSDKNIVIDQEMKTNIPGVFAAGDVTNTKLKQVLVASSQGAIAAKSVSEYLNK